MIKKTVANAHEAAYEVEKGFYASHCEVEKQFAHAINSIHTIQHALSTDPTTGSTLSPQMLSELAYHIRSAINSLRHMRHFFPPDLFFPVLRPYLKCGDIGTNGVIFACNDTDPTSSRCQESFSIVLPSGKRRDVKFNELIYGFRGPTGAMTFSLSAIDAALQIKTSIAADSNLLQTMNEFREYQPVEHVQFIDGLVAMKLRDQVKLETRKVVMVH